MIKDVDSKTKARQFDGTIVGCWHIKLSIEMQNYAPHAPQKNKNKLKSSILIHNL